MRSPNLPPSAVILPHLIHFAPTSLRLDQASLLKLRDATIDCKRGTP
jgi:hypothetical protein